MQIPWGDNKTNQNIGRKPNVLTLFSYSKDIFFLAFEVPHKSQCMILAIGLWYFFGSQLVFTIHGSITQSSLLHSLYFLFAYIIITDPYGSFYSVHVKFLHKFMAVLRENLRFRPLSPPPSDFNRKIVLLSFYSVFFYVYSSL